jgi:hypothetical protein
MISSILNMRIPQQATLWGRVIVGSGAAPSTSGDWAPNLLWDDGRG